MVEVRLLGDEDYDTPVGNLFHNVSSGHNPRSYSGFLGTVWLVPHPVNTVRESSKSGGSVANVKHVLQNQTSLLRKVFVSILTHTRVVVSGSYPLYRLMCIAGIVSSLVTFIYHKWPASFVEATDDNTFVGIVFNCMQLAGCSLAAGAFYMHRDSEPSQEKIHLSLALERMGIVLMGAVIAVYTYGVVKQNSGAPTTWATIGLVFFGLYLVYRFFEIGKAQREIQKPLEQCVREAHEIEELRGE